METNTSALVASLEAVTPDALTEDATAIFDQGEHPVTATPVITLISIAVCG